MHGNSARRRRGPTAARQRAPQGPLLPRGAGTSISSSSLLQRIRNLEQELEVQLALARTELQVRVEDGRIAFEDAVRRRHQQMKSRLLHYVLGAGPLVLLSAPVIYSLIFPLALLDLFVTVYQWLCFPV